MAGNSFGTLFKVTTFGESHGPAIGVVIDGCPAGLAVDVDFIQQELNRRRPGQSAVTSPRNEKDIVEILSGVYQGITLGSPIAMIIRNADTRPEDYDLLKDVYRPSHADFTYQAKYGIRDHRGGGRSSARETAARVMAGSIAKMLLKKFGISVSGYVSAIGGIQLSQSYTELNLSNTEANVVRCPDDEAATSMISAIETAKAEGDSLGGVVSCVVTGLQPGLGEPVFDKLHAQLGKAMLSINAVHGFEYGSGFAAASMKGSEHNDEWISTTDELQKITTKTNYAGGVLGGITTGMDVYFKVAFKPVATIAREQATVNVDGEAVKLEAKGRHDPCVVPRAVPIVEAMAAIVLADMVLLNKVSRL